MKPISKNLTFPGFIQLAFDNRYIILDKDNVVLKSPRNKDHTIIFTADDKTITINEDNYKNLFYEKAQEEDTRVLQTQINEETRLKDKVSMSHTNEDALNSDDSKNDSVNELKVLDEHEKIRPIGSKQLGGGANRRRKSSRRRKSRKSRKFRRSRRTRRR